MGGSNFPDLLAARNWLIYRSASSLLPKHHTKTLTKVALSMVLLLGQNPLLAPKETVFGKESIAHY